MSNQHKAEIIELHVLGLSAFEISERMAMSNKEVRDAISCYYGVGERNAVLQSGMNNKLFEITYISKHWNNLQRIEIANNLMIDERRVQRVAFRSGLPNKKRVYKESMNLNRARRVRDLSNNRIYPSIGKCAEALGRSKAFIWQRVQAMNGFTYA